MKYKSEISAMLHETMQGLHEVGVIERRSHTRHTRKRSIEPSGIRHLSEYQ